MGQPRYDTDTKAVLHFLGFDSSMVATLHIYSKVRSDAQSLWFWNDLEL